MNIILLTANFPYHPGEQFLEGEIGILAKSFEKVLIVPLNLNIFTKDVHPRPVPENVEILLFPQNLSKTIKKYISLQAAGLSHSLKDLIIAAIHGRLFHPSKLYGLCRQYFYASLFASLILHKISLETFNIIYSYWGAGNGLTLHFLKKHCFDTIVFASRVHSYDLWAERQGLKRLPFQKHLLNSCDIIAPVSEQGETYLKNWYGQRAKNVRHFHLGVTTQNTINNGSIDDILRVVTCSFIVPVKRLQLFVSALMKVSRKVIWTHIGDGQDRKKIFELSTKLPQNIQTNFLGHLENEEVLDYYRNNPVDLFLNVSSYEGVPVSIMESLSFGIEPVATDVGGVSELVKPEFGTLLNPDFQPDQLANILQKHQNTQERRIKAQEHQLKHFSFPNYQAFASELLAIAEIKRNED
ncbi:MAG: glycosyltransferase [Syntrophobacteraceae bacterium]